MVSIDVSIEITPANSYVILKFDNLTNKSVMILYEDNRIYDFNNIIPKFILTYFY